MKKLVLAGAFVILTSGLLLAEPGPGSDGAEGTIVKIEGAKVTFYCEDAPGKDKALPFTTTAKTEVTLDGRPAKVADLKVGMNVVVTLQLAGPLPESGPPPFEAIKIEAKSRSGSPGPAATSQPAKMLTLDLGNKVTVQLVLIPAGKFTMGSPQAESGRHKDETQHEVSISRPFYMGIYDVTQQQFQTIMGQRRLSYKPYEGADKPMIDISWNEAHAFCQKVSAMTRQTARLPTEAEWEYACRAGSKMAFNVGETITTDEANFTLGGTRPDGPTPVGSYKSNAWGLYEMHGNVSQYCADWFGEYPAGAATDPTGPATGKSRVYRGGSWGDGPTGCRSARRGEVDHPANRLGNLGFRVVVPTSGPASPAGDQPAGAGDPGKPSATSQPNKPAAAADLSGPWELTWRDGRKRNVTIEARGPNRYQLERAGALIGPYEVQGDKLVLQGNPRRMIPECVWQIKDANHLVVVSVSKAEGLNNFEGVTMTRAK